MHRRMSEQSFVEAFLPDRVGRNEKLERIDQVVDWKKLAKLVNGIYASPSGRPSYPPVVMVKTMVLQQWYDASDEAMEEALWDRVSFKRFVGLGIEDDVPDHSTISRFRKRVTEEGLARRLFKELTRQLEQRRLVVKKGTLIDATIVEAQVRRPSSPEHPGARSETDPDAAWTRKAGKSYFGYKAHIGMDAGSGLIREAEFTPANVNDTEVADELVSGDEEAVYADKAYMSKQRSEWLKSMEIKDRIMHRGNKHHPELPYWERRRNRLISRLRSPVEKVFGTLKRTYGYRRVRYRGLDRNATEMFFKCIAYNLRRAANLVYNDRSNTWGAVCL